MNYHIYITHELIMKTTKLYLPKNIKYAKKDFDRIDSIKKPQEVNLLPSVV